MSGRPASDRAARASALWLGLSAVVVVPAWGVFDRVLEPDLAASFLRVRAAGDVVMLLLLWVLWRFPVGRSRPHLLVWLILAVVQVEVAWMVPQVSHVEFYLLGFTLCVYAVGCALLEPPRWTGAFIALSCVLLAVAFATAPLRLTSEQLFGGFFYLATASIVAALAHLTRHRISVRELAARSRLERERERNEELMRRLEQLSHEDPLTGLGNRRRWDVELERACQGARRSGETVAVLLLDLDRFKHINDAYGHAAGDEALRGTAEVLAVRLGGQGLLARLGGDELAVLLTGRERHEVAALAEAMRRDVLALPLPTAQCPELTLSLGAASAQGAAALPHALMVEADRQLYLAKTTRNAVCMAA